MVVTIVGCGHTAAAIDDAGVGILDAPALDALDARGSTCAALPAGEAAALPLAAQGLGAGDVSVARDPSSPRTWVAYSSVEAGPGDLRLVSTRLGFTDDGGATWCSAGTITPAEAIATPPPELTGIASYWVHEVSQLIFDAEAPATERWRLVWHRYLLANTGANDERQFSYGWLGEKLAASPDQLAASPEHKLIAASGYAISTSVQAYNDNVLGPPELRIDQLDATLADCVAVTEPGAIATADGRWLAMSCETGQPSTSRIILVADDRAGHWRYVGALLGIDDAKRINAALDGFTASAIVHTGTATYLLASPSVGGIYKGCIAYSLNLPGGALGDLDHDGHADPVQAIAPVGDFAGACAYDPSLVHTGVVMGAVDLSTTPPTFRAVATSTSLP